MANAPKQIRVKFIENARKDRPDGPPEIFNKGEVYELREDQAYRWINRNKAEIAADAPAPAPAPAAAPAAAPVTPPAPPAPPPPPASDAKPAAPAPTGAPKSTK